jgi:hypothetical protein
MARGFAWRLDVRATALALALSLAGCASVSLRPSFDATEMPDVLAGLGELDVSALVLTVRFAVPHGLDAPIVAADDEEGE